MNSLAKFINFGEQHPDQHPRDRANSQHFEVSERLEASKSDIVQNNLRKCKFPPHSLVLQFLEHHQLINIGEIEKDKRQMDKLIEEVRQIDFS